MILSCDCTIKSVEVKKTKDSKDYLDVIISQQFEKYDNHVFIFGKKVEEYKNVLKPDMTCVLIYNFFWSKKSQKDVMVLRDVTVC